MQHAKKQGETQLQYVATEHRPTELKRNDYSEKYIYWDESHTIPNPYKIDGKEIRGKWTGVGGKNLNDIPYDAEQLRKLYEQGILNTYRRGLENYDTANGGSELDIYGTAKAGFPSGRVAQIGINRYSQVNEYSQDLVLKENKKPT